MTNVSLLKEELEKLKSAAGKAEINFNCSLIGKRKDIGFLFNKSSNKAALLALEGEIKYIKGIKVIVVMPKAYKVDLKQWTWFINEGFTPEDISSTLFKEVFKEISYYSLLDALK